MIKITNDDRDSLVLEGSKSLVLFSAEWCPMCVMFKPEVEKFAEKHPEVKVYYIDVDSNRSLTREYAINSIPAYFVFNEEGRQINSGVGYTNVANLEKIILK